MKAKRGSPADQYAAFMSRAYIMELEATDRYAQFADQLETHNNCEVAKLFRKLADIEAMHAKRILSEIDPQTLPATTAAYPWEGPEAPETAPFDTLHYLMQPSHALAIALQCELQAKKYYDDIAASHAAPRVRDAARQFAADEANHVRLIHEWMKKVPPPPEDWDEDLDPPRTTD